MAESTRPLPSVIPLPNGGWKIQSLMTSTDFTIRGLGLLPSNSVVPVIVVPGIMGTNLRARRFPRPGQKPDEQNKKLKPGESAWRPPNGMFKGWTYASQWDEQSPKDRQQLLDAATLEVDDGGEIILPDAVDGYVLSEKEVRYRGWGEVHGGSYASLLHTLQMHLNQTFGYNEVARRRFVKPHWQSVMALDLKQWGADIEPLTETQLVKQAGHYFPVYAFGYNWLEDCAESAKRLQKRIADIIGMWKKYSRSCEKVILVTHSMGGLVARACAKNIPDQIAGVIHGVMPALGAPVVYRRIACGTERAGPVLHDMVETMVAGSISTVLGDTSAKTTPVLATAPGVLQLLPNKRYPQPWLHVRTQLRGGVHPNGLLREDGRNEPMTDYLHLPNAQSSNPYDLYRDMNSWFRMIDPALADPAQKFAKKDGGVRKAIELALAAAEAFHDDLGDYHHPNTYAFHGIDKQKLAYGCLRWHAHKAGGPRTVLTPANVSKAKFMAHGSYGSRKVQVEGAAELYFDLQPQDAAGDGTLPGQSANSPKGKVKHVFVTQGYDHQNAFNDERILLLTLRLVARIVQGMS